MGADRLLVCSLFIFIIRQNEAFVKGFCRENAAVLVLVKGFRGMRANDVRPYGVILYIYYNHKNSNQNHHGKKKK